MNRLVFCLVGLISVSFVAVAQAAPEWTRDCGLDFWNYSSLASGDADAKTEAQNLDAQQVWLKDHIDAIDHIVEQLILGEMTVDEAVRETLLIQQDRPEWLINCRLYDPTASNDQELTALALIRRISAFQEKARYSKDLEKEHHISLRLTELQKEVRALTSTLQNASAERR
jgi:hypothetical protein